MNRVELSKRVRSYTRDLNNATFREEDILNYLNEGIERIIQVIPELSDMPYLEKGTDKPLYLPPSYHHLLALYSASRCFYQDERHYQAGNMMNEFEAKLDKLRMSINNGEIKLVDAEGVVKEFEYDNEYVVTNNYYQPIKHKEATPSLFVDDVDEGVDVL